MSDRELLEMAAKAAGIVGLWHERGQCIHVTNCAGLSDIWWRPLEDDGDALRLAASLSMCVEVNGMFVHADMRHCVIDHGYVEENTARNSGCILTATRRAIVRAAAVIGEHIP